MAEQKKPRKERTGLDWRLILAGIILASTPAALGFFYQSGYYRAAAGKTREYARYAEQEVGQSCRGVAPIQQVDCFADARIKGELKTRDKEHDEADLVAQQKTALWTLIMALAALVGMAVGVVGVVLVWRTFRATRDANDIAREVAAAQLRSWVVIEPRITKLKADDLGISFHYEVIFKNIGQTAARDIRARTKTTFFDEGAAGKIDALFAEWKEEVIEGLPSVTLMPGEEHSSFGFSDNTTRFIPWQEWSEGARKAMLVVVAAVRYWSAMDNEWHATERSFTVGMKYGEGLFDRQYVPEDLRGGWEGRKAVERDFAISQFHAGETT